MSDLRDMLTSLGFEDARSLLQSGNLIFRSKPRAKLEQLLESEAQKRLGVDAAFFVRTAEEMRAIVANNPFRDEAKSDPGYLIVLFLKDEVSATAVKALQDAIKGREVIRAVGRNAYVVYPDGVGRSKLTNAVIEKKLGTRATGRNWNTVLKLEAITNV
jgi:uncharacterized protein (DUF1697 family)